VASGIIAACPVTKSDDEAARDACAEALGSLEVLRDAMAEPFLWGGQGADGDGSLETSRTTRFNPFVWRKMYLSVMMFPGSYTIEQVNDRTILHIPYQLRQLDTGSFPYPFWHNKGKWESYQFSTELLLFFEGGKLAGALRSKVQDRSRPAVDRTWDGKFTWVDSQGNEQPYVTLYKYVLSPSNPHTDALDAAYRAFEEKSRDYSCSSCHDPANKANMLSLELFSYPNQALVARHTIVQQIEQMKMPIGETPTEPVGIGDAADRKVLIDLAKEFERVGDLALSHEGEAP
jgi:hypothetical protein